VRDPAHPGEGVGSRERPLRVDAGHRERARVVGEAGHGGVVVQHEQAVDRREPVLVDEPREQRVVRLTAEKPGGADHLLRVIGDGGSDGNVQVQLPRI
jgi:hypothetical protein